ncbi:MAG: DUF3592 domain-containing protein [Acidobacteriaceae bacterium]|jgi:hypothetical protein
MTPGTVRLCKSIFRGVSYFIAAWGALFIRRWLKRHRERVAQSWPLVEGVILNGAVTRIRRTSHFHATLNYTYFVGEYRTGKYIHEFAKEADADAFVRIMKDKRVHIRYKQSNPNKTVLEQSVVEQHAMLAPSTD